MLVGLLVLPPLVVVVITSLNDGRLLSFTEVTFQNFGDLLDDRFAVQSIRDTLFFAAGTAPLAVFFGSAAAWITERTDTPGRQIIYVAAVAGLVVPTIIQCIGWILVLGPNNGWLNVALRGATGIGELTFPLYSMFGLIFVQAVMLFPVAFFLMVPTMRSTDPSLEEAAQASGASGPKIVRTITAPLVQPSGLAAGLLCVILTVEGFEVPALIGTPGRIYVLSTEILSRIRSVTPDYGGASAFAVIAIGLTVVALIAYYRLTGQGHRYAVVSGKGFRPHRLSLGRFRWLGGLFAVLIAGTVALPVLSLVWASFLRVYETPTWSALSRVTLDNYADVFAYQPAMEAVQNTVKFGLLAAPAVVVLAFLTSWLALRSRNRLGRILDQLGTLPLVIPGIVLSLALLRVYVRTPLWGTASVMVVAYIVAFLPYGMRLSYSGILSLNKDLEDAAAISGGRLPSVLGRIVLPLVAPTIVASLVFIFVAIVRHLSAVVFLTGTQHSVISVEMLKMWDVGLLPLVAAFSVLAIVGVALITLVVWKVLGRRGVAMST